jgi:glycosyltransferase involved in cell wall biosynthesis
MKLGIVYHMPFWRAADGTLWEIEGSFARYVDSLAPYFDEISLCAPTLAEPRGEGTRVRSANVTLAPLPFFDGPVQFYPKLPRLIPQLARWVRTIDLLHCRVPTPAAAFAFALARRAARPSFLLVVGDLDALTPTLPYRGLKRWLWLGYARLEERNIQWMADRSLTFANGAALATKHSRNGRLVVETRTTTIDLSDVTERQDTCGCRSIRLLTVSRIDPRKGLRVLPEVVRLLADRGLDVDLDIVGPTVGAPGEAERAAIDRAAAAYDVGHRVHVVGPVPLDRLLPMYREYDIFMLPTLPGEGIPRVLLEAMSAGLPIVTTRVAGIPGLVTHEVNGLLVDRPSAVDVADAVGRLVGDGALRRRLIANGYAIARGHTLQAQAAGMMRSVAEHFAVSLGEPSAA